jgi:6,7-dimethyl-8-ribityllumazine synthase
MQVAQKKEIVKVDGARFIILQSKWYREQTHMMVKKCRDLLLSAGAEEPELHLLPGSLELPLAAQLLIEKRGAKSLDAVICFGAIFKGDTLHFEMVAQGCAGGLAEVALKYGVPVINQVIPCLNLEQLIKRTADDEFNKGIEAAHAALEMVAWRRKSAI